MAKKAKKKAPPAAAMAAEKKLTSLSVPMLWASTLFLIVVISFSTVILFFIGMLPTVVAGMVDRTPQRYAAITVGGMNFCGVFPYLLDLWLGPATVSEAINILTDVFAMLVMYAAAGFGWVLYTAVPPVIASFLTVIAQRKIATLRTTQKRIVEEWGEEVANPHGTR